ncbi:hypothetical protein GUITHDRAFT_158278 [Guillardia theta CCMP2712]|uniref:Uncharacterized protein n=1 Tax=Guillardia theta (strain CCMP2712) TaxID=905079 RepID=L1IX39_GUITC|nr:hypothetical protein GUITHDRAFT_158278 [Guillardia theta CCMP2712]EKX40818.1 hypothetical protein GUITHDRAFT_158278 [Guillardia theta CCMP2712]|eukprot:XP_005827798.1 hypothetical protein GUITHDRAFT_158278 [Guillardia theta CCMP2712]
MANLALKEEFQFKIVSEGGIRRLNEMAFEAATNEIKFFVALAMARIAKNAQLRLDMVLAEEGSLYKTHEALIRLALPPPQNSERVQTQAAEALGLLLLEENLHCTLVHAGVLPVIMRQANPSQQSDFRRTALHALRGLSIASLRNQASGCVQISQLESEVRKLAEMAQADAALRLGLACFGLMLKKEKIDATWSLASPTYSTMIERITFSDDSKVRAGLKLPKLDPIDPLEVHEHHVQPHSHHSSSRKESERREEEEFASLGGAENGGLEEEIQSCIQHLLEAQKLLHLVTGRSPPRTWLEDCDSLEAHSDPFNPPLREPPQDEIQLSEPYYQADVLEVEEGEENYLVQPSEEDRALLDSMLKQLALDRGIIADVLSRAKGARGADKAQKLIHAIGDTIQLIADTLGIHY